MKLRLMICAMAAGTALFAADVTSETYGVLAVSDAATSNTVVGVPWRNVNEATLQDVTLSNLVSTANFSAGDIVYLYKDETFYAYTLSNAGVWTPNFTVSTQGGVTTPNTADQETLTRGMGLIVQRAPAENQGPIYLCGRYDSNEPSDTSLPGGKKTLIANPTTVTNYITTATGSAGDQILVPKNGGAMDDYTRKNDGWYGWTTRTVGGYTTKKLTKLESGVPLPPGKGGFYVNKAESASSITW